MKSFCEVAGYEKSEVVKFVSWLETYLEMAKDALEDDDGASDTQYPPIDAGAFMECVKAHLAGHIDEDGWTDEFCPICELDPAKI